jgi:hypothetical protein
VPITKVSATIAAANQRLLRALLHWRSRESTAGCRMLRSGCRDGSAAADVMVDGQSHHARSHSAGVGGSVLVQTTNPVQFVFIDYFCRDPRQAGASRADSWVRR